MGLAGMTANRTTACHAAFEITYLRTTLQRTSRLGARLRVGEEFIITTLRVPKAGGLPTTSVHLVRWLKREGESVKRGEAVVELETDKVTYELDSPADGVLLKILTQEGVEVPVGDAVCEIGPPGETTP